MPLRAASFCRSSSSTSGSLSNCSSIGSDSGELACNWMISLVQKSKLYYFSIYCFLIGTLAITFSYFYL